MKRFISAGLLLVFIVLFAAASASADRQTRLVHRADGAFFTSYEQAGSEEPGSLCHPWQREEDAELLWQRTVSPNIYSSTAVSAFSYIFAGAVNGSPANIELHDFFGDSTPLWSYPGADNYVHASALDPVLAGIEANSSIAGATVHCWSPDSSLPIWSYDIPGCSACSRCIRVSDFGNIVAVAVMIQAGEGFTQLNFFNAGTGELLSTFDCATGTYARALRLSADGSLAVVRASSTLYVVETDTGNLRWTGSAGASAEALGFSEDGDWIATGWTYLSVYHWNGSSYQFMWSHNGGGGDWYLSQCAVTSDGSALVAAWYAITFDQNKVMWFQPSSSTPVWTYTYNQTSGSYQDIPTAVEVDNFGEYAVVGSWGDLLNYNPEIHVFHREAPAPVFTVDSPGSIYDADIETLGSVGDSFGIFAHVSACGKHVHANQMGNGGDLFSIYISQTGSGVSDTAPAADRPALDAFPNPFNPKVTLRCYLPEAGPAELTIYSPAGERIRTLAKGWQESGSQGYQWDGRDERGGEAASGVYLARLLTREESATRRLVLLR